jgi:2-methylfumaryl-CoA hydratase
MSTAFRSPRYGRFLEEFEIGAVLHHPWEVTVDTGMLALCAASFLDATPVFASARYARDLRFRDRPVQPLALLNFAIRYSVRRVDGRPSAHQRTWTAAHRRVLFRGYPSRRGGPEGCGLRGG